MQKADPQTFSKAEVDNSQGCLSLLVNAKCTFRGIAELHCHSSKDAALSNDPTTFERSLVALTAL